MIRQIFCWSCSMLLAATLALAEEGNSAAGRKPVDVRFLDGSTMKLALDTDNYELVTSYGKLSIPAYEIRLIELGSRVPDEIAKQVEEAVANLSSPQYEIREKAVADLLKIGGKGYPALVKAKKTNDLEAEARLEDVIDKVRATLTDAQAETREFDVVHTSHSRISGMLSLKSLRANSSQFGTVEMKLSDVRELRFEPAEEEIDLAKVEAAPSSLYDRMGQIGKTFVFKVTGSASGSVWGTDTYTADSSLATAAVHAGVVKDGKVGIVRVKIVDPPASFSGSARNGISSYDYGSFPGAFKIIKTR